MRSPWIKVLTAFVVGLLMTSGGVASAAFTPDPLAAPKVNPSTALPGDKVTISGTGCSGDPAEVTVKAGVWDAVTTVPAKDGSWSVQVTVPADAKPGEVTVKATCDDYVKKTDYPNATLKVTAKDTTESPKATVSIDVKTVAVGGTVTVGAAGFQSGEKVSATLFSDPVKLGEMTADAKGAASGVFTIPVTVAAGVHRLELRGLTSNRVASAEITVTGSTVAVPTDSTPASSPGTTTGTNDAGLAVTGSNVVRLATVGLLTALVGAGLLALRRRRIA